MSVIISSERVNAPELSELFPGRTDLLSESVELMADFSEIVTPEPADALFAVRAVQLANETEVRSDDEQLWADGAEAKLIARANAAIAHSTAQSVGNSLKAPIVPRLSTVAIVTPCQVIEVEVSPQDIKVIEPLAAQVADSTGVHMIAGSDHELTPRELAHAKRAAIAKAIIDEKRAGEEAKDYLIHDIEESEKVPVLSVKELGVLRAALEAQVIRSKDKADRLQAAQVLRDYGMPVPNARKGMGDFMVRTLIDLAHGRRIIPRAKGKVQSSR